MPTPLEQLATANAEVTRLSGLFSSIPGGDIAALLTEHARRGTELERLQGMETNWNALAGQILGGDVSAFMAEHTRLGGEVSRLTAELSGVDERIELRAAEIVAGTGNQVPAAADTTNPGATTGTPPAQRSYDEHWSHYSTLSASEKNAYYKVHSVAMNARRS